MSETMFSPEHKDAKANMQCALLFQTLQLLFFFLRETLFLFTTWEGKLYALLILTKGILLPASFQRQFSPAPVAFPCKVEQRMETYTSMHYNTKLNIVYVEHST
jgi:hypothetical protein